MGVAKNKLVDLLLATPEYKKKIRQHLDVAGYVPYRYTPLAINRRVGALSQVFTYALIHTAMTLIRHHRKVKYYLWVLHPEASAAGPCPECIANAGVYYPDDPRPAIPAHPGCVCSWEIVYQAKRV